MTAGDPSRREVWAVHDGKGGHRAQSEAVARALAETLGAGVKSHVLAAGDPWRRLPPTLQPARAALLPPEGRALFERAAGERDAPLAWVAAGRLTAPWTRALFRRGQAKRGRPGSPFPCPFTVQLMDPGLRARFCDLQAVPQHDAAPPRPWRMETLGAPVAFEARAVAKARAAPRPPVPGQRLCAVMLGGPSRHFRFTPEAADALAALLEREADRGWGFCVSASRRTPPDVAARLREACESGGHAFWGGDADGANPYLRWLAAADAALVTEDSASMMSDAAWFALPLHIFPLEGASEKFTRLHDALELRGLARRLRPSASGEAARALDIWPCAPLREAGRVAEAAAHAMGAGIQPR